MTKKHTILACITLTLGPPCAAAQGEPQPNESSVIDKRLGVLESLWENLSQIYPALEYKGITGREWLEPAEKRIRQAKSDAEFYDALLEQMARLNDTHSRIISYPGQPKVEVPPVRLNQVEGKVAVIQAHPSTGLSPGDVITAVDGRPADRCLADRLRLTCNSTQRGRIREACEHFVSGIEAMGHVLLVGAPTNGAGGGPTQVTLPDGTQMRISRALGLRANGVVFEGHGIPPHILSTPILNDLRTGRDAALSIGKDWILSNKKVPSRFQRIDGWLPGSELLAEED